MNSEQHDIFLAFHRYQCAITGRRYGSNYPNIQDELHPLSRMTVDHLFDPDFKHERFHELAPLYGETHQMKDNACRDAQITYLKKELADLQKTRDGDRRRPIIEKALHFIELDEENDMAAYLKVWASQFVGKEPPEYIEAMEREQAVDRPKREKNKKEARKKDRLRKKARASKAAPPQKHRGKEPRTPKLRISQKAQEQMARPILNG